MNNLFDPNSRLGSAFNDIFGEAPAAKPQDPPPQKASNGLSPVARIGAARPIKSSTPSV
jgi:hypothetical protein